MKGDGKLIMRDPELRKLAMDLKRAISNYRSFRKPRSEVKRTISGYNNSSRMIVG